MVIKYLATSDAIAARHDVIVGDDPPPNPTFQQPGKNWQNTLSVTPPIGTLQLMLGLPM